MSKPNIFFGSLPTGDHYMTGTGQTLYNLHRVDEDCIHYGCVIHQPSDHRMRSWRTHWDSRRQLMLRVCPHRRGHPDPDQISYVERMYGPERAAIEAAHRCDGCCVGEGRPDEIDMRP